MNVFEKLGEKVNKAKFAVGALTVSAAAPLMAVVASAEDGSSTDLSTYATQIQNQFTTVANEIIPILVGVLGAGLTVFSIFAGIRLAKKMFTVVSK